MILDLEALVRMLLRTRRAKGDAMTESAVPQSSSTSMKISDTVPHASASTMEEFWQSFRLFPSRFETYGFQYWYLPLIALLLVIFFLDVVIDLHTMSLIRQGWSFPFDRGPYQDFDIVKAELTNWLLFVAIATIILMMLSLRKWWRSIPSLFQILLSRELITSTNQHGDVKQEFVLFLEHYQQALLGKRRYVLIGASVLVFLVTGLIQSIPAYLWLLRTPETGMSLLGWLELLLREILFTVFYGYFLGAATWTVLITGRWVRKLSVAFDLVVQPGHPDYCGGLKPIGTFCLGMVMPILLAITTLAVYSILSIWYPFLIDYENIVRPLAGISLILFALPLASLVFFAPLWGIHSAMLAKKETYEFEYATRAANLERKMWSSLDSGALVEAKAAKEEMEILQVLHPEKRLYPTWPFDRRILLVFLAPQCVSFISILLPLMIHAS